MKVPLADPFIQEFFEAHLFATQVTEQMLELLTPVTNTPEFAKLLGLMTEISVDAARTMIRIHEIRSSHPVIYALWSEAVRRVRTASLTTT